MDGVCRRGRGDRVRRAAGFFLNSANYQLAPNLVQYGTWISACLAYATSVAPPCSRSRRSSSRGTRRPRCSEPFAVVSRATLGRPFAATEGALH
jgi:hypothetical protein